MPELQPVNDSPRRRHTDNDLAADQRRAYRQIAETSYALFQQRGSDPEHLVACWQEAARIVLRAHQASAAASPVEADADR